MAESKTQADDAVFRLLFPNEWPAVDALEKAAWPAPLQANAEIIKKRFALGHSMMGAWREERLIGLAAYTITASDPFDEASFPKTFAEFSSRPRSEPAFSAYTYNLCVHPAFRSLPLTMRLMGNAFSHAKDEGCRFALGDGRCPAYAGSTESPDHISQNPRFRAAIDTWQRSGQRPDDAELIVDPVLRFYWRTTRCRFLYLRPQFLPDDLAAGGFRVIFVIDLQEHARRA